MKEFVIKPNEANQRFDKYLKKLLPNAGTSFIYKMLRKKNITLNKKKAAGNEVVVSGDVINVFFSDETFDKFTANTSDLQAEFEALAKLDLSGIEIVSETTDVLVASKPANMLSQKAVDIDISANERLIGYLINTNQLSFDDFKTFKPSVCNRLDRNTTGLILMGKTLNGLQTLSSELKDRSINKYYRTIVSGQIPREMTIKGYLTKNTSANKVTITDKKQNADSQYIETAYRPISCNNNLTLLEVHLITGRSHQIRAHLASLSHPLAGDYKYGDAAFNRYMKDRYRCSSQMLHSYELDIPDMDIHVHTDIPELFVNVLKGEDIWEPGIPEALEVLH